MKRQTLNDETLINLNIIICSWLFVTINLVFEGSLLGVVGVYGDSK